MRERESQRDIRKEKKILQQRNNKFYKDLRIG